MSYSTPPTFSVDEDLTSTDMNTLSNDIVALAAAAFPLGVAGAAVGTPPAAGQGFKWQAGYSAQTTDGSGNAFITFATPFPAGVIAIIPAQKFGSAFPALCEVTALTTTGATFTFLNSTTGTALGATGIAVMWFAVGF